MRLNTEGLFTGKAGQLRELKVVLRKGMNSELYGFILFIMCNFMPSYIISVCKR